MSTRSANYGRLKQHQPQQQQSYVQQSGRPSLLSRRSSIAFGKTSQSRVDPRPINDKGYQIQCMRTLVEYLSTHGYNAPISPKLLPSGKEIREMIEFLFAQVHPSMRKLGKLEDDVPFFFRMIGYPFQISKSALHAAGSPHSWPGLLAALTWLVELLNYEQKATEIRHQREDQDMAAKTFQYIDLSYKFFMNGDDESCAKLDGQIQDQFNQETAQLASQNEQYKAQIAECKDKLQSLRNDPSPLDRTETKKQLLLEDIQKFNLILDNFTSHKQNIERRIEERKQELEAKQSEITCIAQENDLLKEQVSAQEISATDYERMLRETHRVEEELTAAVNSRKELEHEAWHLETKVARKMMALETAFEETNSKIGRLKLLPSDAQAGHANPFELKFNAKGETAQDVLGIDFKGFFMPKLTEIIDAREVSARETMLEITALREEVHTKEDTLNGKHLANTELEQKNKKLEGTYKKKKTQLEKFLSTKAVECEALREELEIEEEKLKMQEAESQEQLKRAKMETEQLVVTCEEEHQQKLGELMSQIEYCMQYKEHVQSVIASAKTAKQKFEIDVTVSRKKGS